MAKRISNPKPTPPPFRPVPVRTRHDGWTVERQRQFIEALAETACVEEACRHVGLSSRSAYNLRRRAGAIEFRAAWDAALEYSMARLSDAVIARAVHGVPVPHFYKGEQVGEHRRYDERLAMWLLRIRDPARYGRWREAEVVQQPLHYPTLRLATSVSDMVAIARGHLKRSLKARLLGSDPDFQDECPEDELDGDEDEDQEDEEVGDPAEAPEGA